MSPAWKDTPIAFGGGYEGYHDLQPGELDKIREGWDHAAREDAMGNIVTIPGLTPAEFWRRGCDEIDQMVAHLGSRNIELKLGRALDFGCGVGRLTQALAEHFKRVDGVDISPEMVDRARGHNRHPGRVEYHRNTDRIPFRERTFDLIYSRITLQHMPQDLQKAYLAEFLRVLKPSGVAVFQIPDGPEYHHPNEWLSMYGTPRGMVQQWVRELGGCLLDVELLDDASPTWLAYRYTVRP